MPEIVHVAVAVIVNENDEVCISLRHEDAHQGGLWEFPGGKMEGAESVEQALAREIKEELNLVISDSRPLITIIHQYPDKQVCLHVRKVTGYQGEAVGAEDQPVKWVAVSALSDYAFPDANIAITKALQLPDRYLITGKFSDKEDFIDKLTAAVNNDIKLVQCRLKADSFHDIEQAKQLISAAAKLCEQADAKLMLNVPD
ncbi:MAG: 8-oxo-dGTP diphosphatase MutT, partial [Proteobacteria bacterium]|nr:8-oxo-dGTP diphosphatase MutT [Pseudomonadota bacterium]